MKWIVALLAAFQALVLPQVAYAQDGIARDSAANRTVSTTTWVEEWDPATNSWVRVAEAGALTKARAQNLPVHRETVMAETRDALHAFKAVRYAVPNPIERQAWQPANRTPEAIAQYGPFLVLNDKRVAMVGPTDAGTPIQFDAMIRDFPKLKVLEMIEAPGTSNDIANLAVGRKIRAAGLSTHVPRGGSVRSGAVELFLAGVTQRIDDGSQFAVHSWLDNYGRQPGDFAADDPANRLYLDYYVEMGMSEKRARAFYAMTNSVPHASAKWLKADEMRGWIAGRRPVALADDPEKRPVIAVLEKDELPAEVLTIGLLQMPELKLAPAIKGKPSIAYESTALLAMAPVDTFEQSPRG